MTNVQMPIHRHTNVQLSSGIEERDIPYKIADISEAEYEKAVRRKIEEANILSWDKVLLVRMFLLGDCDWTQLGDNGLTDEKKALWLAYRAWIRDNPRTNAQKQDAETTYDVIFPITPDEYLRRNAHGRNIFVKVQVCRHAAQSRKRNDNGDFRDLLKRPTD